MKISHFTFILTAKTCVQRLATTWVALLLVAFTVSAQQQPGGNKFSPEKFDAELQKFITAEAHLTLQEAAAFFPVYHEMQKKQRMLFGRQHMVGRAKPCDEQGCLKAIQERDEIDVELKRIQQQYHNKFLELIPASKVYDVINAEDKFHRHKLRQWSHGGGAKQGGPKREKP